MNELSVINSSWLCESIYLIFLCKVIESVHPCVIRAGSSMYRTWIEPSLNPSNSCVRWLCGNNHIPNSGNADLLQKLPKSNSLLEVVVGGPLQSTNCRPCQFVYSCSPCQYKFPSVAEAHPIATPLPAEFLVCKLIPPCK